MSSYGINMDIKTLSKQKNVIFFSLSCFILLPFIVALKGKVLLLLTLEVVSYRQRKYYFWNCVPPAKINTKKHLNTFIYQVKFSKKQNTMLTITCKDNFFELGRVMNQVTLKWNWLIHSQTTSLLPLQGPEAPISFSNSCSFFKSVIHSRKNKW